MKNELALSGERIENKIYPELFRNVGMIRGEYLIRELKKNILLCDSQKYLFDYLIGICNKYCSEEVWYRFSELTNSEANCLEGTGEQLDEKHPLFGVRGTRRLLKYPDEFIAEIDVIREVYKKYQNLSVFFPFINDSTQLEKAIKMLRNNGFHGKIGTMIELPSAYLDLDNILKMDITRITIGMNDLTSFIYGTVRNSEWHNMESNIMLRVIKNIHEKAKIYGVDLAIAGYLSRSFIDKMNRLDIKCIIHYSQIPQIFNKTVAYPEHLKHVKESGRKEVRTDS